MDPASAGVTGATLIAVGPVVQDLLKRAAGPAADEIGEWLAEKVRDFRRGNAQAIGEKAVQMIAVSNLSVNEVPLHTLLPLLDAASLEDDEELQERWAALLANAATRAGVPPHFPRILAQMGVDEARVLSACGEVDEEVRRGTRQVEQKHACFITRPIISAKTGISPRKRLELALDVLAALRCIEHEPAVLALGVDDVPDNLGFRLTELGHAFLKAVTPPSVEESSARAD